MATTLLLTLLAVALTMLLVHAVCLWLVCKLFCIKWSTGAGVGVGRALLIVLGSALLTTGILAALHFTGQLPALLDHSAPVAIGAAVVELVLLLLWLRLALPVSFVQTLAVGVVWLALSAAASYGAFLGLTTYAAEAFIVPTGAMADTILGHHKDVTCPSCGYPFAVNASQQVDPWAGATVHVVGCVCPNCRQNILFEGSPPAEFAQIDPDFKASAVSVPDPKPTTGDRILTAKGPFKGEPRRLDVLVFEFPDSEATKGPKLNYVKRLIGLPGETVVLCGGKPYVLSPDAGLKYDDPDEKQTPRRKAVHKDDEKARELFRAGKFEIVRKSPEQMLALRHLVYDNDHPAKDLEGKTPRWSGEGGELDWQKDGTAFRHGGSKKFDWLTYRHIPRGSDRPELVTDFVGYNTSVPGFFGGPAPNWAGDLMLECEVEIDNPGGDLVLNLGKGADRFEARFDLGSGVCTLVRLHDGKEEKFDSKETPLKAGKGTYAVRFANIDQKLTLWVNDTFPFGRDGTPYAVEDPSKNGPRQADLEPARIGFGDGGAAVTVRHLKLWRDTYYTYYDRNPDGPKPDQQDTWTTPYAVQSYYVQPDHYFFLGDNSAASSDSRDWGLVPRPLLLGKAVMVYYPFGRLKRLE
jgi:signal peptidase I